MENKTILLIAAGIIALLIFTSPSKETGNNDLSVTMPKNVTPINKTVSLVKNKCGYTSFGVPNYVGTEKANMTCKDALPDLQNQECVLNPPKSYDGAINKLNLTSSPLLTCCVGDGTCQWLQASK